MIASKAKTREADQHHRSGSRSLCRRGNLPQLSPESNRQFAFVYLRGSKRCAVVSERLGLTRRRGIDGRPLFVRRSGHRETGDGRPAPPEEEVSAPDEDWTALDPKKKLTPS
jgi:hypothetical protein